MEYKCLPENSSTEESKPSTAQPFDTIDIEKSAALSSSTYGTIPSYTSKEGRPWFQQNEGRGIWISFVQSLVAVGMFTAMAVTLVLVIL
ncbi:hypothetical protein EYC84_008496 [Monilinia fructicola]|uniref:Uncharacterized protein n=1 Tax=Monilinia fructicola TaxID=38448 RepID=A0A5M9JM13_MONFR|nr:hypothetical protein EYC84_008496 [Monilinia fructicola]